MAFKASLNTKKKGKCNYCGKEGHWVKECRKKLQNKQEESSFKQCKKCNNPGHTESECWKGKIFPTCKYCKKDNHPEEKCRYKEEHENKRQKDKSNMNNKVSYLTDTYLSNEEYQLDTKFVCDSGATGHLTREKDILTNIKKTEEIKIGCAKKGSELISNMAGSVEGTNVTLTNVAHVPNLSRNLLSVNTITNKGGIAVFTENEVKIVHGEVMYDEKDVVLQGEKKENGLYIIDLEDQRKRKQEAFITQEKALEWHNKLGHLNFNDLKKVP